MLSLLRKLFGGDPPEDTLPLGAQAFLEGRSNSLAYADVDPEGAEAVNRYEQAMVLKRQGDLAGAAGLLVQSCIPPSIYQGHYRELFKIWRQMNRDDLKSGSFEPVISRVNDMIRLDEEMIKGMLTHWGTVQKRELPGDYFDKSRNLLQADGKALLLAGTALGNSNAVKVAEQAIQQIKLRK